MKMSNKKSVWIVIVALVLALSLGLTIFHSPEEVNIPKNALAEHPYRSDKQELGSLQSGNQKSEQGTSPTSAKEATQTKARFTNAEQLCSDFVGKVAGNLDSFQFTDALLNDLLASRQEIEDWLHSVASNGTPRQQGAALSLLTTMTDVVLRKGAFSFFSSCDNEKNCPKPKEEVVLSKASFYVHQLVNLAIHNKDPALHGMAYHLCKLPSFTEDKVCGRVETIQWLHLDPDNGAAALYALGEMPTPKNGADGTTFENALYRLSIAKRFDFYFNVGKELPPLPPSLDSYQYHVELEAMLWAFQITQPLPAYVPIIVACNEAAVKNQNRRFICEPIVKQLMREDATLLDRVIARKLAANLAWDQQIQQQMSDDVDAVKAYMRAKGERESRQLQNRQGKDKTCHQQLKEFASAKNDVFAGEFKHYLNEISQSDIPRDELIKMVRKKR